MLGVFPEAMDWNFALCTQISFWVSISEDKALSEPNNLQNCPNFWDLTSDILALPCLNAQHNVPVYCLWINTLHAYV